MGAYLRKPITDKTSECGEYTLGGKKLIYAATAMQGWRVAMEDAHSIVPDFDKDASLFAVYDGHGGKEVAIYCAAKLGDIIKATNSYSKGDICQALKDAFMKCDEIVMKPETVQEMKKMINIGISAESEKDTEEEEDPQEELKSLMEEANVPLHTLLAKYGASDVSKDSGAGDGSEVTTDVKSVLQMMANKAGIEIEFEDTDSDIEDDSESENETKDDNELIEERKVLKSTESCTNDSNQNQEPVKIFNEQEHEQSHPLKAAKFSLASLLTSSSSDTTYANASISSASDISRTSLSDTHQSLHYQDTPISPPPSSLHDTLLLTNHTKAHTSNLLQIEKSLHSETTEHHQQFVDTIIKTNISDITDNETGRICECSFDDAGSKLLHNKGDSTSSEISVNDSTKVGTSQTLCTSVAGAASSPSANDSSVPSTRTKTVGLVDLLTTAVEDKDPSLLMDSSEDKWMSPQPLKEVPVLRRSRKRPHPDDDMDDLTLSEYSAKRHEIMDEEGYHSGTTAVVCILKGDELTVANAGDSRCVVSSKGKALEMSFDHKPTDPPELERIAKAGGQVGIDGRVNGGLNLTRAIGDHFYKGNTSLPLAEQMITAMPDIETLRITEDEEFIFLACDGIWNSKSSQDVVDFINCRISEKSNGGPPTADDLVSVCKSLCDACLAPDTDNDGTGCDNMTCLLVFLQPDQ